MKMPFGTLECSTVTLNGEVTASSQTGAEVKGIGEATTTTCPEGGLSLAFTDLTLTSLNTTT